jgi:ElaB/YqjD/DUF883 family membrane-anchored ribosome-binding protein
MSESSVKGYSGLVDESGRKISNRDTVEPLVQYMQEHPVCTALAALGIGFLLGKTL